jgi:MYXO-CTERM domain-containing protein
MRHVITRLNNVALMSLAILGILERAGPHGSALAAPSSPTARDSRDPGRAELPPRIHRKANGRYTQDLCDHRSQGLHCLARQWLPEDWRPGDPIPDSPPPTPPPPPPMLSASMIEAAYNIPSTAQANGKIVALLGSPDNHALADLAMYRSAHGLPAMDRCRGLPTGTGTACFAQVAQDGGPSINTDPFPRGDGETSLDMAMVSLGCPDCSILLVEISPRFCESDVLEGAATAAKLGASATSISLGGPEATDPNAISIGKGGATNGTSGCPAEAKWQCDAPGPYSTPGHLVFVSAGDHGYDDEHYQFSPTLGGAAPSYPASSPYVVAVGGTALYWSAASSGEGLWSFATTSGCSTEFAMPPWQAEVLSGTSCKARATADVSAMATFFSDGVELGIETVVNGQTLVTEGTSASAPLVAAIFTRLGLTTEISNDLSWIYKNRSAFNDIGSAAYPLPPGASNTNAPGDSSCGMLCTAGPGWDGPSGVGSPNGAKLAALPVSTAGPEPYPDAGVSVPYNGLCGADPGSIDAGAGGCACEAGGRGRSPGMTWVGAVLGLALVGAYQRSRSRKGLRRSA